MERAARRTFEQQPVATEFADVDMARDQRGDFGRQRNRPPAERALGSGEQPFSPRAFERTRDRERRPGAVEVAGVQRQIFARSQARGQCHKKNESGRILAADGGKTPRLLRRKDLEFAFIGAGQRHLVGWIPGQQLPAPGLAQGAAENGVGIANRARRKPALGEAEHERLQIERLEPVEPDFAQRGAHVTREERPVIPRGFGAQPVLDRRVQPPVEVFIEGRARFGARRDLGEETGEFDFGRGTLAMDRLIKVAAPAACGIPALIEPHKPGVGVTADDLAARHGFPSGKIMTGNGRTNKREDRMRNQWFKPFLIG